MSGKCFDELVYAMYVDGEVTPEEKKEIEIHLESCPKDRELVNRLEAENESLRNSEQWEIPVPDLVPAIREKLVSQDLSIQAIRLQGKKIISLHPYRWGLAAAAAILVIVMLFFFREKPGTISNNPGGKHVIVFSAKVEGQEVESHIYEDNESDTEFIWLEKIGTVSQPNDL